MPGLKSGGRPAARQRNQMPRQDAMRQPSPERGDGEGRQRRGNVSEQEQQIYDATVGQAYNLIYDEKVMPGILQRMQAGEPVESLATTTVLVVSRVKDSADKEGIDIPGDVLFHAGMEVLQDLANLSAQAGIHEYGQDEKEAALYQALDTYRDMMEQSGKLDSAAMQRDWDMLMQADKAGRLDEVLPGASKLAERAQQRRSEGQRAMQGSAR